MTTRAIAPNRESPWIIACSSMPFGTVLKNPMRSQVQEGDRERRVDEDQRPERLLEPQDGQEGRGMNRIVGGTK